MPITEAVIAETLRLSSIVVGGILHKVDDNGPPINLGGFTLPPGKRKQSVTLQN